MREVIVRIRDDIEADQYGPSDAAIADKTVDFSFDGVDYQIDLTAAHADEMTAAFAPYVKVAREAPPPKRGRPRRPATETVTAQQLASQVVPWDRAERARVRAWANKNGYEQSDIGVIKQEVREAFYAAHPTRGKL